MQARASYTSLRRRADFSRVHVQGQRKGDALLQVRVLPRPASVTVISPIRLGIIVSKKYYLVSFITKFFKSYSSI